MKLTELEPEWVRYVDEAHRQRLEDPATLADAHGILFLCPVCFKFKDGPIGTHSVLCWFRDRGVPDSAQPGPGRWAVSGTGFADLTLQPSVQLLPPEMKCGDQPAWHGFITNGEVT